jgi:signal transduction histidine kinase
MTGALGLVGLAERVSLSGGTFTHGPDRDGDFVVHAALRWQPWQP